MKSKKLGKITTNTKTRISSPFEIYDHKTERSCVSILMHWMRNIIEQENIDLGLPNVETKAAGKYPDTIIYKTRRSRDVLCGMEFKLPYFDPFDEELKNDNLLPENSIATIKNLNFPSFAEDLLKIYTKRFGTGKFK